MQIVPLQAVAAQTISITLGGQACSVNVYTKATLFDPIYGAPSAVVFCDLSIANAAVIVGVPCWNANQIVRDAYLGFIGDLAFYDTTGNDDPDYDEIGTRFVLVYLAASDLVALGLAG